MGFLSYLRVETIRIFKSKSAWLFAALTAISPLLGFTFFVLNPIQTASTQMIINPVMTGMMAVPVLFALFTLLELDRVRKYKTSVLTDAIAPPMALHAARMGAITAVSLATGLAVMLAYLPYTAYSMEEFFDLGLYIKAYSIFMIPGMWMGSLFAAVFYLAFRRVDVSFIAVLACAYLAFNRPIFDDFLLRWINPNLYVFSDAFGNAQPFRMGIYNRQLWLLLLGGAWLVSFMFTRKYEKGVFGSIPRNIKKFYLPAIGTVMILLGVYHYQTQPFYNNAPIEVDWDMLFDLGERINASAVSAEVTPDFNRGRMKGRITYNITENTSDAMRRFSINSGYTVYSMTLDGVPIPFTDLKNDQLTTKHIEFAIPHGGEMELVIEYGGYPMLWGLSTLIMGGDEISRENVDLRTGSLIPTMGISNADVTAAIVLPGDLVLFAARGEIAGVLDNNDGTKTWTLTHHSDNLNIYASDYVYRLVEANDITVEFYHHAKFTELLEENNIDQVLIDVFNFCTERFGPLHYLLDDRLKLIQTSAFNMGGGAGHGVSNMGETTFSIYSLTDPWKGAAGMEILAHEIIHQWWGLNRMIWDDGIHPEWSSEGLTVYTTYRLYKEKYGEEYARVNYVEAWQRAVDSMNRNFYRRNPEYLSIMPESFAAHIRVSETQVAKYSLMPLKILKAEELVGGEEIFDAILFELANSNIYEIMTYQEFLDACGLTEEELKLD
ncbi:MAG: hypothetical protein FWE91_03860 [Defluviitaleaceae bacterium]|nr:hypothetical protein [Defluviitaleaceae bacterium]MCL2835961.1 hypothetical protein [Defluviitaleaceae bacterium]